MCYFLFVLQLYFSKRGIFECLQFLAIISLYITRTTISKVFDQYLIVYLYSPRLISRVFLRPNVTFQVTDLKMSALIILCFFAPWLEKKRASMIWLRTWKNVQGIRRSLQISSKNACISNILLFW